MVVIILEYVFDNNRQKTYGHALDIARARFFFLNIFLLYRDVRSSYVTHYYERTRVVLCLHLRTIVLSRSSRAYSVHNFINILLYDINCTNRVYPPVYSKPNIVFYLIPFDGKANDFKLKIQCGKKCFLHLI